MKKHGCLWWLCISWWWLPIKWTLYTIPAFIIRSIIKFASSHNSTKKVHTQTETASIQPIQQSDPDNTKTYRATGMTYHMAELLSIATENDDYTKTKKELVDDYLVDQRIYEYEFYPIETELIPEPDNQNDPNAIKVVVDGAHIAYIKAGSCAHLQKVIKENRIDGICCEISGGKYKYVSCDYDEDGEEKHTMEKGEAPFSVVLRVIEK